LDEKLVFEDSVMRFRVSTGQKVLAAIVFISFVALSLSILSTNKASVNEASSLTKAEAPAASIIFTQRETFVYAVRLSQWLNQQVPRRDVQIARSLLAQRLQVVNSDGTTIGQVAPPGYLTALAETDASLAGTNPGILTSENRVRIVKEIDHELDVLIAQARLLVSDYQLAVDNQLISTAKASRHGDFLTLLLLIIFMALTVAWFIWTVRSTVAQYRVSRNRIIQESHRLELLAEELEVTNQMVDELENLNEQKNEFISNISHELRTPLTSIIGYVDVLSATAETKTIPMVDGALQVLDRNASILLSLVQSLLSLSQLDSPHHQGEMKSVDLAEITEDSLFILQSAIERKDLTVHFEHDLDDRFFVNGDAGLLSQLVINLIANAIKFSYPSKILEVSLKRSGSGGHSGQVVLTIRDHGIGIPEDEIPNLFERFYRASNAVEQHIQGSGLGLAIVSKVAQIHGASVTVNSKVGDGTSFSIGFADGVSKLENLIKSRKFSLLEEAIKAIRVDEVETLKAKLHEYGGALGFYDFAEIGEELLVLSRSLPDSSGAADASTIASRNELIEKMKNLVPTNEMDPQNV
jgi:signal transduction histidine kinase